MNNLEIIKALAYLKPEAEYTFTEDDYSTIEWHKLEGSAPTFDDLQNALIEIKKNEAKELEAQANAKTALLEKLGITADEAKLLLA